MCRISVDRWYGMSKDVILEAKNVLDSAISRIENRVLSKAVELKPRTVSIAQRISSLLSYMSTMLEGVAEKVEENKKITSIGSWLYVVLDKNTFTLIRSKPYTITISYRKGDGKVYLKTRRFKAMITPASLELQYLAMKINIDVGSVDDIIKMESELKYLLKKMGRIVEFQLLPVVEKRLSLLR